MKLFIFLCAAAQVIVANSKILPFAEPCHKSDPNLKNCLLNSIQENVIPRLSTGAPEFKIPPVDPLDVPFVIFNRTLNPQLVLNAILKNAKITGFSQVSVEDLQVDADNLAGEMTVKHPWFALTTEFKVNGKIMSADIETQGYFSGNFSDVTNHFKLSLKPVTKRGVTYYTVENFKLDGTIGHAKLNIIPKNPQDQSLIDFILSTYTQNERAILDVVAPLYGETMGDVMRSVLEQSLAQIPAERLIVE